MKPFRKPFRLAPSLLSADFAHLAQAIDSVREADYIHIDVMDGLFVPNITFGPPVVRALHRLDPPPLDVHLMIDRPSRYVRDFLEAGAGLLTLHVESDAKENLLRSLGEIRAYGARPAVTLRPKTPLAELIPYLPLVDMVLLMTVEPGFGGQKLLPEALARVNDARSLLDGANPGCDLEVDGGVTLENITQLAEAGANVFVAGSAVFDAPDIPARLAAFREKLRGGRGGSALT